MWSVRQSEHPFIPKLSHLSFLVQASETQLKWSKALEYETSAMLIKLVMFNSILSSASSFFFTFLCHWSQVFLCKFNIFIHAARRSVPRPFPCLFSSFSLFLALYKLRLPCSVFIWTLFTSLFVHIYSLTVSFPSLLYCLLEFRPTFSSACQVQLPSIC